VQLVACERCHAQFDVSAVGENKFRCHCGTTVWNRAHAPVDAPIQRCAACGAAVAAQAAACDYCTSPIIRDRRALTLICPECFARCAGNARYCGHCGVEFRPQPVTKSGSSLDCPTCQAPMATRSIAEVAIHECPECNGLWVPGESFDLLVTRARSLPAAPAPSQGLRTAERHAPDRSRAGEDLGPIVYRRCPVCRSPMHRKNFGHASGVIVDWCGPHGTWLDPDELERIAAFIQTGGFDRARAARAAEQAADLAAAEKAAAERIAAGAPGPRRSASLTLFEHLLTAERPVAAPRSGGHLVDLLRDFLKSP
jgi:Zn-finger nucleic acid-binding protein